MDYAHYSFLSYLSEVWLVGINDTKHYMKKMEKKEYFEYGEYIRKNVYKSVLYAISVFICCIITFGQV